MGLIKSAMGWPYPLLFTAFLLTTIRNEDVSRPLGASARRVLLTLDNPCGRKKCCISESFGLPFWWRLSFWRSRLRPDGARTSTAPSLDPSRSLAALRLLVPALHRRTSTPPRSTP